MDGPSIGDSSGSVIGGISIEVGYDLTKMHAGEQQIKKMIADLSKQANITIGFLFAKSDDIKRQLDAAIKSAQAHAASNPIRLNFSGSSSGSGSFAGMGSGSMGRSGLSSEAIAAWEKAQGQVAAVMVEETAQTAVRTMRQRGRGSLAAMNPFTRSGLGMMAGSVAGAYAADYAMGIGAQSIMANTPIGYGGRDYRLQQEMQRRDAVAGALTSVPIAGSALQFINASNGTQARLDEAKYWINARPKLEELNEQNQVGLRKTYADISKGRGNAGDAIAWEHRAANEQTANMLSAARREFGLVPASVQMLANAQNQASSLTANNANGLIEFQIGANQRAGSISEMRTRAGVLGSQRGNAAALATFDQQAKAEMAELKEQHRAALFEISRTRREEYGSSKDRFGVEETGLGQTQAARRRRLVEDQGIQLTLDQAGLNATIQAGGAGGNGRMRESAVIRAIGEIQQEVIASRLHPETAGLVGQAAKAELGSLRYQYLGINDNGVGRVGMAQEFTGYQATGINSGNGEAPGETKAILERIATAIESVDNAIKNGGIIPEMN